VFQLAEGQGTKHSKFETLNSKPETLAHSSISESTGSEVAAAKD